MPLPAALASRLAKRGLINIPKSNTIPPSTPTPVGTAALNIAEEEVIAEDYDSQKDTLINNVIDDDMGEDLVGNLEQKLMGHPGCPNKYNIYHECTGLCLELWGDGHPEPDEVYKRKKLNMLLKYPLPDNWVEVLSRHYYWDIDSDVVSWLSPRHPKAVITESAAHLREELKMADVDDEEDESEDDGKESDAEEDDVWHPIERSARIVRSSLKGVSWLVVRGRGKKPWHTVVQCGGRGKEPRHTVVQCGGRGIEPRHTVVQCVGRGIEPRHTVVQCGGRGKEPRHTVVQCVGRGKEPRHTVVQCGGRGKEPRHTVVQCGGRGIEPRHTVVQCGGRGKEPRHTVVQCVGRGKEPRHTVVQCGKRERTSAYSGAVCGKRDRTSAYSGAVCGKRDRTSAYCGAVCGKRERTSAYCGAVCGKRERTSAHCGAVCGKRDRTSAHCGAVWGKDLGTWFYTPPRPGKLVRTL
uniref:Uncharacterized protein n=1 Tax=Timema genevievae TaxID=629358 RepID=A0A7R9K4W9_TIMGE|nr:unnamed protein product [Timema genevievae]